LLLPNFYVLPALSSHFPVLSKFCIMNNLLHFLLLCQSCRSFRNAGLSFGGRILGLIKSAYHGSLSMMTSSEAPFLVLLRVPQPSKHRCSSFHLVFYCFLWLSSVFRMSELNVIKCKIFCNCNCN